MQAKKEYYGNEIMPSPAGIRAREAHFHFILHISTALIETFSNFHSLYTMLEVT